MIINQQLVRRAPQWVGQSHTISETIKMNRKVLDFTHSVGKSSRPKPSNSSKEVLRELFTLLEEYAPIWYSEDLHNRAIDALTGPNRVGKEVPPDHRKGLER